MKKTIKSIQFFAAFIVLMAMGCGGATKVTGTVTLKDGTPFTEGAVMFENEAVSVYAPLDCNGKFTLFQNHPGDGVPPGTYQGRIVFDTDNLVPGDISNRETVLAQKMPFPMKYLSFDQSELTLTVEPGKSVHINIVLE